MVAQLCDYERGGESPDSRNRNLITSCSGVVVIVSYIQGVPGGMCQTSGECSLR